MILWVMNHSEETLGRRLVLMALAENANDDGSGAWPSVETLARKTRLSTRQVKRCLSGLEASGSILPEGVGPKGTKSWCVVRGGDNLSTQPDNLSSQGGQDVTRTSPIEPVQEPGVVDEVLTVWDCYVTTMSPRRVELPVDERRLIRDALTVATADECCQAIRGCSLSPFHMGQNDRGKKYNRLTQILKAKRGVRTLREQIDMFLEIAESRGGGGHSSSAERARIAEAKRNVLDAHSLSGSEHAKKRGEMAALWLAEHGWRVVTGPDGRPTFEVSS